MGTEHCYCSGILRLSMKYVSLIGVLVLSASPAFAQFDQNNNCIMDKESEIQKYEEQYQTGYQWVLKPETTFDVARQMEQAGKFPSDFSSKEKYDAAYKLITDELRQMRGSIETLKTYPDCSELQGGKGQ